MRVGEIVREGPMTVEVRCRGVGGGEAEDEGSSLLWLLMCLGAILMHMVRVMRRE